jgi:hypothetical protein
MRNCADAFNLDLLTSIRDEACRAGLFDGLDDALDDAGDDACDDLCEDAGVGHANDRVFLEIQVPDATPSTGVVPFQGGEIAEPDEEVQAKSSTSAFQTRTKSITPKQSGKKKRNPDR